MSEQRLENGSKAMSGPEAAAGNPTSAHEAARFIASVSLSLGALMLALFGIIERMVTFEKPFCALMSRSVRLTLMPGVCCSRVVSQRSPPRRDDNRESHQRGKRW